MESILATLLQPTIRNAATIAATALVTKGLLAPEMTESFVTITGGAVLGGISYLWSVINARKQAKKLAKANEPILQPGTAAIPPRPSVMGRTDK